MRAIRTAEPVARACGAPLEIDADLREIDFGAFDGRTFASIGREHPELYATWMRAPTAVVFPDGETWPALRERAERAIERIAKTGEGRTTVAVTLKGAKTSVRSCRGAVVLVDEPAEPVSSPHLLPRSRSRVELSLRRIELQPAVRTLPVVVVDEFLEHAFEVPSTKDERPVEALVPCRAHPALGERVGLGSPDRGAEDSESLDAKHLVEGSRELGVAISDEQAER
jgi:broad specificity phosphatase PhoE